MEHLLSEWLDVANRLREARRILLMSDYDGTLTPIVEKPELAELSPGVKELLRSLSHQRGFTVAIISGRAIADIKAKVGIKGIIYAGNHGLEIEGPGISFVNPIAHEFRPIINVIHYVLTRALGKIRGIFIENKGLTISVHYRNVEQANIDEVHSIVQRLSGSVEAAGKARITPGKKVYEVKPAVNWDKGKAIKLLMRRYGKGGRRSGLFPIYMGDDLTDEDGFRVIEHYGQGISVFVGEPDRPSLARYFLRTPDEVTTFLTLLLSRLQPVPDSIQETETGDMIEMRNPNQDLMLEEPS